MMTGIIYSIMLMQIGFRTIIYRAYIVRIKLIMAMSVIIIMAAIINTVVLVHLLYGAIFNRVIGGTLNIGNRNLAVVMVSMAAMAV